LGIEQADNPDPLGRLYAVFAYDIRHPLWRFAEPIGDL
jgi:hypothetical protein